MRAGSSHTLSAGWTLVVRTIRGLERIAADEFALLLDSRPHHIGHREVWARAEALPDGIEDLRTVDDAFLVAAITPVDHTRSSLRVLRDRAARIDVPAMHAAAAARFGDDRSDAFEVVGSHLGRANYSRFDLEDAVAEGLERAGARNFRSRRHGRPLAGGWVWRVHAADGLAWIGLRLMARPLQRRGGVRGPGATPPPMAAAMARVAAIPANGVVMDPCCGTGTILAEVSVAHPDATTVGADIALAERPKHPDASSAALMVADAGRMPLSLASVDRVVTNPPWGRQVRTGGTLQGHIQPLWDEIARILRPGGRAVVLVDQHEHLDMPATVGLVAEGSIAVRLRGRSAHLVLATR